MLKIAIVGAGFAGLGLLSHLIDCGGDIEIVLFDQEGVGKGASGIACGLLHPFPAGATRLSFMGYEALHHSIKLLHKAQQYAASPIASFSGILKLALDDEQKKQYARISRQYDRLQWVSHPYFGLLIEQGITVFCQRYLEALWLGCQKRNVYMSIRKIRDLAELDDFDIKVLCVGAGIQDVVSSMSLQKVKGQILRCHSPKLLTSRSILGKGYVAITNNSDEYHIGSTYEHHFDTEKPVLDIAKKEIFHQLESYLDDKIIGQLKIIECQAGVRVMNPKNHLPIIKKIAKDAYCITGLGSRGLLYHGLLGHQLAQAILFRDDGRISREFFQTTT